MSDHFYYSDIELSDLNHSNNHLFIDSLLRFSHYSIQADLDMPDLLDTPLDYPDTDTEVLPSGAISRQYSRDATTSTVSIQGSGNHYHACASDDFEDVGFDPSILPPPDPWIDSVTDDPLDVSFNSSTILEVKTVTTNAVLTH